MSNNNWEAMRMEYIAGFISDNGSHQYRTLEEIADRYGVAHSTLLNHSSAEHWTAQRAAFQEKIYKQAFTQFENDMQAYLSMSDRLAARAANLMLQHIVNRLENATDDKELDALTVKFGDLIGKLSRTAQNAFGVDLQVAHLLREDSDEYEQTA